MKFLFWSAFILILARFTFSGIWVPLQTENIEQVWEEFAPLKVHLQTGQPIEISNPRQYGPVFFLICEPLWFFSGYQKTVFANYLFYLGVLSFATACIFFFKTLRASFPGFWPLSSDKLSSIFFPALLITWVGSSPILYILNVKNVESWELALISLALYFRLKNVFWLCGFFIALATLIKILPIVFLFYFLLCDRKSFFYSFLFLLGMMIAFSFYYGPQMGLLYPLLITKASLGNTWGAFHMENLSLKGYVLKLFFNWKVSTNSLLVTTPLMEKTALFWAHALQILGGFFWLFILLKKRVLFLNVRWSLPWEWAWVCMGILVFSPQTAFEYATISQGAFSFCCALWILLPYLRSPIFSFFLFSGIFLVLNIMPRSVVNKGFFISYLNDLLGNQHLTASEGYQLYGFPLFGFIAFMLFLIAAKLKVLKERAHLLQSG